MDEDCSKEREIEEVLKRMDYLKDAMDISILEKIDITRRVLAIIEKSEAKGKQTMATSTQQEQALVDPALELLMV